jgi:hypothetical protein
VEKIQVLLKSDKNNGYFTFMTKTPLLLLRMRNISDKSCIENQDTHFMFNNFFSESRGVYEIMWKNTAVPDRPQVTIQHGACALHVG